MDLLFPCLLGLRKWGFAMDVFLSHKKVLIPRPGTSREPISFGGHRSSKSISVKENTAIGRTFSAGTCHTLNGQFLIFCRKILSRKGLQKRVRTVALRTCGSISNVLLASFCLSILGTRCEVSQTCCDGPHYRGFCK